MLSPGYEIPVQTNTYSTVALPIQSRYRYGLGRRSILTDVFDRMRAIIDAVLLDEQYI